MSNADKARLAYEVKLAHKHYDWARAWEREAGIEFTRAREKLESAAANVQAARRTLDAAIKEEADASKDQNIK